MSSFYFISFCLCLTYTMNNKDKYGEVFTPPSLVEQMMDDACMFMGDDFFWNKRNIFETGCGKGIFYNTLIHNSQHIHEDACYTMNEINVEYKDILQNSISPFRKNKDKVVLCDLFHMDICNSFDIVWGNLPFHNGGKVFVPGMATFHGDDSSITKPKNVVTIWPKMIHLFFNHVLKKGGHFFGIIPCIWLKQDKACIYDLFVRKNKICFLKVFDCYQAHKLFGYNCQTPMCYVMVEKLYEQYETYEKHNNVCCTFPLYDHHVQRYIDFTLLRDFCIPSAHASLFQKHVLSIMQCPHYVSCYEKIKKISLLKQDIVNHATFFFNQKTKKDVGLLHEYTLPNDKLYKVITGASWDKQNQSLILHGFVSYFHGLYYGIPKLILPHKRLLKVFKDIHGNYSCYGRDMYVFLCPNGIQEINALEQLLSFPEVIQMVEQGFKVRMNFIEKYVFQYINYHLK